MTYSNGDVYDGEWKNNKRHGEGAIVFQNKTTYTGRWSNNKINGYGTYKYFNGDLYEGTFDNGVKSGDGKMTYYNGDVYTGKWKNDLRHGIGKQTYKTNGDAFEGSWRKDKRNGQGKLTKQSGEVVEDTWEDDETMFGQISSKLGKLNTTVNSVASPLFENINDKQSKLFQLTGLCTTFAGVLVGLTAIRDQFISLLGFSKTVPTALIKTSNEYLQVLVAEGKKMTPDDASKQLQKYFNKLVTDKKIEIPTGIDIKTFADEQTKDWGKGLLHRLTGQTFYGYGVYIAGIGLVTLGYFIYLRIFGDEEQNDILDKEIRRTKKSSKSTKKKRR